MSTVPEIEITLGGKLRKFRFSLGAMAKAELKLLRLSGQSVNMFHALSTNIDATALQALLWAGLLHEDPNLEFDAVGELLAVSDVASLLEQINGTEPQPGATAHE